MTDFPRWPNALIFTDLDGTLLDAETYGFAAAASGLDAAREAGAWVILCSSKTRAEMVFWQGRLGIEGPFVSENGGGIFHSGAGPLAAHFPVRLGGLPAVVLGTPYEELRAALRDLRAEFGLPLLGFGDLDAAQVAELTGLPPEQARLARERDFDEPFVWLGELQESQNAPVRTWLCARRLRMVRGGRFWHLTGRNDKGSAVRWLRRACRAALGRRLPSLALGDSENDLPMLHAADRGVLVERPGRGHLEGAHAKIRRAPGVGPAGWATAVEAWLAQLEGAGGAAPRAGGA